MTKDPNMEWYAIRDKSLPDCEGMGMILSSHLSFLARQVTQANVSTLPACSNPPVEDSARSSSQFVAIPSCWVGPYTVYTLCVDAAADHVCPSLDPVNDSSESECLQEEERNIEALNVQIVFVAPRLAFISNRDPIR